ncbi:MAG: hypothetical protein SFU85_01605 [Candidatus Methylacidiphilales bacterium]|nr:hypothetical protein [Candidatus Methylacidiphilales bacterium]
MILSLGALGVSLYLLHLERKKNADQATLTEKAMKMVEAHPDAEVFQVEDERGSAPAQKKK